MDYLFRDIPSDLWDKITRAAANRGQSERSFLLNAAFNEVERTRAMLNPPNESLMANQPRQTTPTVKTNYPRPDVGDKVALALRDKTLDEAYAYVSRTIGVEESELRARFKNSANPGTHRMSLGNVLRGFYRGEDSGNRHLRNLRTVGIKTLIRDFETIRDRSNQEAAQYFQEKYGYAYTSANTKVSTGKRIISDAEALLFCLNYIVHNSTNIDEDLRNKARKILTAFMMLHTNPKK